MAWNSTLKALSFRRNILKGTSERNKEPRYQRNMGQHGHKNSTSERNKEPRYQRNLGQHGHKNSTSYGAMIQMFQMLIYGAKIQMYIYSI